jgi:ABC transport system ATP-binding/permease protein
MNMTLRQALAPEGDSVVYQDRVVHVASWAARFLFTSEQLSQPVERLSGGERARVLIAQLMLQPADILLLDEPTNDLDIPTLEILEESLLAFRGSLVLVTHDRYMLDRVSNIVLGLDGRGGAESFADYAQWESWQAEREAAAKVTGRATMLDSSLSNSPAAARKKLSYMEAREYAGIEQRIADAEQVLRSKRAELENPAIASDGPKLVAAQAEMEAAQRDLDVLYARWAELEEKSSNLPDSNAR